MGILNVFRSYRTMAFDPAVWHKCANPIIPRRTVGGWTSWQGQTWRRLHKDGYWEYRQDPESDEEFLGRTW